MVLYTRRYLQEMYPAFLLHQIWSHFTFIFLHQYFILDAKIHWRPSLDESWGGEVVLCLADYLCDGQIEMGSPLFTSSFEVIPHCELCFHGSGLGKVRAAFWTHSYGLITAVFSTQRVLSVWGLNFNHHSFPFYLYTSTESSLDARSYRLLFDIWTVFLFVIPLTLASYLSTVPL